MEKIKQLREKTGAGMVDCKKALDEANGDIEKAVEILRKKGISKAAKRLDRDTNEGVIKISTNKDKTEGYIVEINVETDFVAKNEKFQNLANQIFLLIQEKKPADPDVLLATKMDNNTVEENLGNLSGTIGEKMTINKFEIINSNGMVSAYSHMEGRIGVLVAFDKKGDEELAKNIAMQIAALNPKYLKSEDVPEAEIKKEKEIYREQLLKEGKNEEIIEKIMVGKIKKYCEDVCLLEQEYILEDKKKVGDVLGDLNVEKFIRYSL